MSKPTSSGRESIRDEATNSPVAENLCFVLQRTYRAISRRADTTLRAAGLTAEQSLLLAAIAEAGSPRAADLSQVLGLNPSTIATNLKPLVRRNWVTVRVDVGDRRARRLFLTGDGSERLKMALKHLQEFEEALAMQMGGDTQYSLRLPYARPTDLSMPLIRWPSNPG
ncbi:MarR family winged helix-turn-helix transcriptional regulator [Neorhizobium alkalisoli]|uniref:MarR family winged helix-turn-helix transcriptional regulator n=1 Tax=Neorhizobium alkalisoli TaxID=528178 RepID=UPI000CF87036|nr:MarR family transcriptional regulator [Neorhizobium alkalisoli]